MKIEVFVLLSLPPFRGRGGREKGWGVRGHRMRWNSFALRLFFSSSFFYCCFLVSSLPQYFMQNRPLPFPPSLPLPSAIQWANLRCKLPTSLDLAPGRSCDFSCSCYCSCCPPPPLRLPPRLDLHWFRFCHVFTSYLCVLPRLHATPPPSSTFFAQLLPLLMWLISTLPLRFGHLLFQFACRFYTQSSLSFTHCSYTEGKTSSLRYNLN